MAIDIGKQDYSGFLPVSRRLFEHHFWTEKREYSKLEAWLDLMQLARWEYSPGKFFVGLKTITYRRGELVASVRFLGDRWAWSKSKVERFLTFLEEGEKMISRRIERAQTIISLTNYETYNAKASNAAGTRLSATSKNRDQKLGQEMRQTAGQQNPQLDSVSNESRDSNRDTLWDTSGTDAGQTRDNILTKNNKENKVINISFEDFWEVYDKKVGNKEELQKKWMKLTDLDRKDIMAYLPAYKRCQPNKKFRKNPEGFLNNKSWKDELTCDDETNGEMPGGKFVSKRPSVSAGIATARDHLRKELNIAS
jgi:hypothetical protein